MDLIIHLFELFSDQREFGPIGSELPVTGSVQVETGWPFSGRRNSMVEGIEAELDHLTSKFLPVHPTNVRRLTLSSTLSHVI